MAKKVVKPVVAKKVAKKEVSIPALLKELENCEDQLEKRKIRAKLRKAGHIGGISAKDSKAAAKSKKNSSKKTNRKAKQVDADDDE